MIKNIEKEVQEITKWIKEYVEKSHSKGVVVGNSGGKDSATVIAMATRALGKENVLTVAMPCNSIKEDLEDDSKKSLYVSLFGNLNGATVKDVNFKDVKIDVNTALTTTYKIYLAPLGIKAVNATVENVTFEGSYTLSKLPENRTEDEMLNVTNAEPFVLTEGCTVNNVTVTLAKSEKE